MKFNNFYLIIILLGIGLIFISPAYFKSTSESLPAVTYAKDHKLTADIAAEVIRVWVKPGQQVKPGDTLLELNSQFLSQEIEKLDLRLSSVISDRQAQARSMRSAMNLAKAEIQLEISALENDIRMADSQLSLNRKISGASKGSGSSPLEIKIRDLQEQVSIRRQELAHREDEIKNRYALQMNQQQNQEILLRSELAMLKTQRNELIKVSDFNGVVENVYVKAGEVVEEYTDLLSVLPSSPSSVVAYMPSGSNPPAIGSPVSVHAVGNPNLFVEGKVIGHGSIVPLPDILQKATAVKAFGKEIFIEIPVGNTFSTGEKVLLKQKI